MTVVGVSGTSRGMTFPQLRSATRVLDGLIAHAGAHELRHGDCVGADAQFHSIALALGLRVCVHPPVIRSRRAFCDVRPGVDRVMEPDEYMARNTAIVEASSLLIAAPKEFTEIMRSGTWSTVRRALRRQKRVIIVWPTGDVCEDYATARPAHSTML